MRKTVYTVIGVVAALLLLVSGTESVDPYLTVLQWGIGVMCLAGVALILHGWWPAIRMWFGNLTSPSVPNPPEGDKGEVDKVEER